MKYALLFCVTVLLSACSSMGHWGSSEPSSMNSSGSSGMRSNNGYNDNSMYPRILQPGDTYYP
ncbi:MAG TPA: hypothetical protein VL051_11135 [Burkholderiaceae bacterium]|nr:hypothetical protein [Burkholderiaceae bacterium]